MNPISIFPILKNEWKELQCIAIQTFTETYKEKNEPAIFEKYINSAFSEATLKQELNHSDSSFFFIKNNDEIVGYLKLNVDSAQTDYQSADKMEIERIYVLHSAKGQGCGRTMIEYSIEAAKRLSKSILWLGVWTENPDAIAFYKRMGFRITATHSFFFGADEQLDYVMEMEL